jgi:hypothetical protein
MYCKEMKDQQFIDLYEAYASIYETKDTSVENEPVEVDEDAKYDRNRKRAAQRAAARNAARDSGQTGAVPGVGYVSPRREGETYRDSAGVERHKTGARMPKKEDQKEETDLFDYILEYLVAEGYADTNENALVIMANMSEEWREEILDESRGAELRAKHGDNPSKKLETKAFGKAMSYDNRDRLPTGTGTEVRGRYLGLSGRARSRARGETPASSAVGPRGESRTVRRRGGRATGIGAGENRDRPTG